MSAPAFGGLARPFTHTIARVKDTDGSISYYEYLALAVVYTNKNPRATALRNKLFIKSDTQYIEVGTQDVPTPSGSTRKAVIGWDIDAFIPDAKYPSFISVSKPTFTTVPTSFETFDVTVEQFEGRLILFRNISNTDDILRIQIDGNEYAVGLPKLGTSKGDLQLCFVSKTITPRRFIFQWRSDNGVIEKAVALLALVQNFVEIPIKIRSWEIDSAGSQVSDVNEFNADLNLISIEFT
jgi:hypothetical protein